MDITELLYRDGFSWNETKNMYRVIRNDCPGFNNLSYTTHLR